MSINMVLRNQCCLCVPPTIGILIWAYITLVALLPLIGFFGYIVLIFTAFYGFETVPKPYLLLLVVVVIEWVFNLLLIVAAHKKITTLLTTSFYYNLISISMQTVSFFWLMALGVDYTITNPVVSIVLVTLALLFVVFKIYMTLVIKFEINKLKDNLSKDEGEVLSVMAKEQDEELKGNGLKSTLVDI